MKTTKATFVAVLLVSAVPTASASTMIVRVTGVGSGSLAGTQFDSAPFEVSATYNTEDVRHYNTQFPENLSRENVSDLRFVISGVGQGAIEVPSDLFANRLVSAIGLARRNGPDFVGINSVSLKTYDLLTPIGPTSNLTASATHFFFDVPTSSGELDFSTMRDVIFQVAVVPEPTSIAILATGFFVLVWHWRRRAL